MKVVIVGAGASGLMCAIKCAESGHEVFVIEKNEKAGKKIYITGKGRCNITNLCSSNEFLNNVVSNNKFLYSSINTFSPKSTIEFFEKLGVPLVVERGNRVFPKSYKASDITKALENRCRQLNVRIYYFSNVKSIKKINNQFKVYYSNTFINADKVVIATGGLSYPLTGSTGDGYKFGLEFGHNIIDTKPSLVRINVLDQVSYDANGLLLKNVSLSAYNDKFKKTFTGEMSFGPGYIDGPIVISMSSYLTNQKIIKLSLDLKIGLSKEELDNRLIRDFKDSPSKTIKEELISLIPSSMVNDFLKRINVPSNCKVSSLRKEQRLEILSYLKDYRLEFSSFGGYDRAIITQGGIDVKQVNPKTFESKIIPSLYFIGEVLDVDALTGGFNMQIALSTGYCCGLNME